MKDDEEKLRTHPPTRTEVIEAAKKKLREWQKKQISEADQLAAIDWWIGQLFDLKARLELRQRI